MALIRHAIRGGVGLVAATSFGSHDLELQQWHAQRRATVDAYAHAHAMGQLHPVPHELYTACSQGALVLLANADLNEGTLDGVKLAVPGGIVGFGAICPGRHLFVDASGAMLDFVLYASEAIVRGRHAAGYTEVDDASRAAWLAQASSGMLAAALVDYFLDVGVQRLNANTAVLAAHAVAHARRELEQLLAMVASRGALPDPAQVARASGQWLAGVPLAPVDVAAIVDLVAPRADDLAARGDLDAADHACRFGLAFLPGDAALSALAASLLLRRGDRVGATHLIAYAMSRPAGLDPGWTQRALATRAALGHR